MLTRFIGYERDKTPVFIENYCTSQNIFPKTMASWEKRSTEFGNQKQKHILFRYISDQRKLITLSIPRDI